MQLTDDEDYLDGLERSTLRLIASGFRLDGGKHTETEEDLALIKSVAKELEDNSEGS